MNPFTAQVAPDAYNMGTEIIKTVPHLAGGFGYLAYIIVSIVLAILLFFAPWLIWRLHRNLKRLIRIQEGQAHSLQLLLSQVQHATGPKPAPRPNPNR